MSSASSLGVYHRLEGSGWTDGGGTCTPADNYYTETYFLRGELIGWVVHSEDDTWVAVWINRPFPNQTGIASRECAKMIMELRA